MTRPHQLSLIAQGAGRCAGRLAWDRDNVAPVATTVSAALTVLTRLGTNCPRQCRSRALARPGLIPGARTLA